MKKLSFICMLLASLLLSSCKDSTNDYVEQLYTNASLTSAARTCLTLAKDTALAHLCVTDGFNANTTYRFQLPTDALFRAIADTLETQNQRHLLDTLATQLNRSCEQIGNSVSSSFKIHIDALTLADPASLIYSSHTNALTQYFRTQHELQLLTSLENSLAAQNVSTGAADSWRAIQNAYYQSGAGLITYNPTHATAQNMLSAIFTEMANEEALIRTDSTHATASNLNVFK